MSEMGWMMCERRRKGRTMAGTRLVGEMTSVEVEELEFGAGVEMLRMQVSDRLGISLEEFFDRLDRGDFDGTDDENLLRLVMLVPFARVA